MLYFNPSSIDGIDNYKVIIKSYIEKPSNLSVQFPDMLCGIMNDKEISLPFGVTLTNTGDIKGASAILDAIGSLGKGLGNMAAFQAAGGRGGAGMLAKAGRGLNLISAVFDIAKSAVSAASDVAESLTGIDPAKQQVVYSVVRPEQWQKPKFEFKCTFYKGMKIGDYTTPSFKTFAQQIAVPMLPSQTGLLVTSMLESNQVKYRDMIKLLAEGMGKLGSQSGTTEKSMGFGLRIGKVLNVSSGLWLTGAKINAPTAFDSKGQPIYWDVSFEFEYYRMPTVLDMQTWLK